MGIFSNKSEERIWKKLNELQELIDNRTPEIEKDARQASKKTSEYRNRAKETKEEVEKLLYEVKERTIAISNSKLEVDSLLTEANNLIELISEERSRVVVIKDDIIKRSEEIEAKINSINGILEKHPDLETEAIELEDSLNSVQENSNKISAIVKNAISRKSEIDKIYSDIVGYSEKNEETGEETHINGLKDDLENQYEDLESDLRSLEERIRTTEKETKENYTNLLESSNNRSEDFQSQWTQKYEKLEQKIKDLLPNALTAGLSYAFSEKKDDEISSLDTHKKQFFWGIGGLILVSILPFIVSLVLLLKGDTWEEVVSLIPRLVIAIIPLYLPVLWLAYSANKKINLSKRLIEEYTHKEVLSKTFEGLSTQIKDLENDDMSKELKVKLLFDFLHVSSENPGKLISDYETSDHPLMDVLEKSYKLESAVDKLQKIPGMNKVAQILDKKSTKMIKKQMKKVEEGLDNINDKNE